MVRVGPWMLEYIQRDSSWTQCERCSRRIKEVWQCTVDANQSDILEPLDGQATWRVGSTCGPTLLSVSEDVWGQNTRDWTRRLNQLIKVTALIDEADRTGFEFPEAIRTYLHEYQRKLSTGTIGERELRHCGLIRAVQGRALKAHKEEKPNG